jgi:hypothetical protein
MAFSSFFEQMLPDCRVFIAACPGTRAEDPEEVLQAFINHFVTPPKDNPIPNFRRYGHKGQGRPYAIWFLKCFCNFLKEHYPASGKAKDGPLLPSREPVNPFGPVAPPSSSPQTADNIVPLRSDRPNAVPERATKERPQPTRENPFHEPGDGWDESAIIEIPLFGEPSDLHRIRQRRSAYDPACADFGLGSSLHFPGERPSRRC